MAKYNILWVDDQNGEETPVPIPNTEQSIEDCVKVKLSSDLGCTALGWETQDVVNLFNGDPLLIRKLPPHIKFIFNFLLDGFFISPDGVARPIKTLNVVDSGTVTPGTGVQIPFRA